jgi:hypothetical protein
MLFCTNLHVALDEDVSSIKSSLMVGIFVRSKDQGSFNKDKAESRH